MTTLREAAQQALDAMEYSGMDVGKFNRINAACAALRAALAEPVQSFEDEQRAINAEEHRRADALAEPVQEPRSEWSDPKVQMVYDILCDGTTPPNKHEHWEGWVARRIVDALTKRCPCGDRTADQCPGEWEPGCDLGNNPKYAKRVELTPKELAASIKRGEKWKVAEPVQEPVAWYFEARHIDSAWAAAVTLKHPGAEGVYMRNVKPLYTAPPQRMPLTDEEIKACEKQAMVNGSLPFEQRVFFARAIERAHGIGE